MAMLAARARKHAYSPPPVDSCSQMGAYEHALRYATERLQFGKPIGGFQLVQDLLVRMLGNVVQFQTMCLRVSQLQDEGE
jgi:glutaryl-CoA dehydrogenase